MGYKTWQSKLEDACRVRDIPSPVFQIMSDRRGGRTAWSSSVTVLGQPHRARFWYDGKNLQNAKDDAAEVAYNWLVAPSSPATSRSSGW
ncbi:DRBM domain-containing protein [Madurella fahalii]|uniref:DRBM domain-containing protein n=1 Tax=Madurella fahalii TaxID=1157608 RepID=A0ABQ0GE14_9PEZI